MALPLISEFFLRGKSFSEKFLLSCLLAFFEGTECVACVYM